MVITTRHYRGNSIGCCEHNICDGFAKNTALAKKLQSWPQNRNLITSLIHRF